MRLWLQLCAVLLPLLAAATGGALLVSRNAQADLGEGPPEISSVNQSPATNGNGWNNTPVRVSVCAHSHTGDVTNIGAGTKGEAYTVEGRQSSDDDCTDFVYSHDTDFTERYYARDSDYSDFCSDICVVNPSRGSAISSDSFYDIQIDMTLPWVRINAGPIESSFIPIISDPTPSFEFEGSDVAYCELQETAVSPQSCVITCSESVVGLCALGIGDPIMSGVDTLLCAIDPDPLDDPSDYAPCTSPYESPLLANGEHFFCVMALDLAGNYSEPDCAAFVVDAEGDFTPPVLTITYAQYGTFGTTDTAAAQAPAASNYTPGTWSKKKVAVFITCTDEEGGSGIASNTYAVRTNFFDGIHAFNPAGACVDNAGNAAVEPVGLTIMVDTVAPVCDVVQPAHANKSGVAKAITITISATDATSGVASKTVSSITREGLGAGGSFTGAVPRPSGSVWNFIGANGVKWKVLGVATDAAGHSTNCTPKTILSK